MKKEYLYDGTMQMNTFCKAVVSGYKHCAQETLKENKEISTTGMAILLSIYCDSKVDTISSIAANIYVSKGLVSREVEKLKNLGFVEAATDENDRRMVRLKLSESVLPLIEKQIDAMKELTAVMKEDISEEDFGTFLKVATKIQSNLNI